MQNAGGRWDLSLIDFCLISRARFDVLRGERAIFTELGDISDMPLNLTDLHSILDVKNDRPFHTLVLVWEFNAMYD